MFRTNHETDAGIMLMVCGPFIYCGALAAFCIAFVQIVEPIIERICL